MYISELPSLLFPLEVVTDRQFARLGESAWSRRVCDGCEQDTKCVDNSCFGPSLKRMGRFCNYYREITATYHCSKDPTLARHEDLFAIIRMLRENPDARRCYFVEALTTAREDHSDAQLPDVQRAIDLAARVLLMVNCTADQHLSIGLSELGGTPAPWKHDLSLVEFIIGVFPQTDHSACSDGGTDAEADMTIVLMARKLRKSLRLKFVGTDDLRSHLKLNPKSGTLLVFHHTAWLKQQLKQTRDAPSELSTSDCIRRGAIPRQLALEALDSVQKILFPLSDNKSRRLLASLVATAGFDPDGLRFESAAIRHPHEKDVAYRCFGARLAELRAALRQPPPRGGLAKWLERRSRPRYVLLATLAGVLVAIGLGIAALAVASVQTWISYQAWQHPVQPLPAPPKA